MLKKVKQENINFVEQWKEIIEKCEGATEKEKNLAKQTFDDWLKQKEDTEVINRKVELNYEK